MKVKQIRYPFLSDYQNSIMTMRNDQGLKFRVIAKKLGKTTNSVSSAYAKAQNKICYRYITQGEWYHGLSERIINCIKRYDINSKKQFLHELREGMLSPSFNHGFIASNFGWEAYKQCCTWLGIKPNLPKHKIKKCPHCGKVL